MGKGARNRAKRSTPEPLPLLGKFDLPDGIEWTPIEHSCQCVVEWGWHKDTCNPMEFMQFVAHTPTFPCGWHGAETGRPIPVSRAETVMYTDAGKPPFMYCKRAAPERISLGQQITRELKRLFTMSDKDMMAAVENMHPGYREFLRNEGHPVFDAWREQKVMDLILNRDPRTNPFSWPKPGPGVGA